MYDMPRLSIFKPEKGNDYKFFDRNIKEMFQVGGTDLHLHKYLGPYDQGDTQKDGEASPTQPNYAGSEINETTIQDLLFLENRDRKYSSDIYTVRGIYNVQDADFNLSQFGMFLQNDTLFLTVHLNDIVERIGRKPMAGDVLEFPHMKDDFSLDESIPIALKRYYVIEDVNRAAEGFSQTWWPHLLRLKLKTLVDSQEFRDILGDATTENSVASYMSTFNREKTINDQVVAQAEADAPKSGFNYKQYYVAPIDERGNIRTDNVNTEQDRASSDQTVNASIDTPASSHYGFYLDGDGVAPNGNPAGFGISFPISGVDKGDYFLRTDYLPNRLFRYDGNRWVKIEDSVRITTTNNDSRANYKTGFVNNTTTSTINGLTVEQRQALSNALKPKADN
tara:strand:+ start:2052 stop:3230 length:1179 start_codon:yes stop_codon:yes gene_type:complete